MSDDVDNSNDNTHDVNYLEQCLSLQPGAIEAQQRGERRSDLPIVLNYGGLDNPSQTAYAANPVKEAVFVIDIASKEPTP